MKTIFTTLLILLSGIGFAQSSFDYEVQLTPVTIPNLPGLHSFVFGQSNGKWLIIGGRLDGVQATTPTFMW